MANLELVQYINSQIEKNIPWEKIKGDLLRVGWTLEIVEESYQQSLKDKAPQESLAAKPAPAFLPEEPSPKMLSKEESLIQAETSAIQPEPLQQSASAEEPLKAEPIQQQPAQPAAPTAAFSNLAATLEKPKKKSWLVWIIVLVVLILGLAGGGYAYYQYVYPQQIFYTAIEKGVKNFGNDKAGEITIALNGNIILKEGMPLATIGKTPVYKYASFQGDLKTNYDISNIDNAKGTLSISAQASFKPEVQSSESINVNGLSELRLENNNLYLIIQELNAEDIFAEDVRPQVQALVQDFQGQWLGGVLSEEDIRNTLRAYNQILEENKLKLSKNYDKYKKDLKSAIQIKLLGSEKIENDDCFYYQIVLDKSGIKNLNKKILDDYAKENSMQSQYSEQRFENDIWPTLQTVDIKIWIAKKSSSLRKWSIAYNNNFEKYSDFSIASLSLNLSQAYKKLEPNTIAVAAPQSFKNFRDVYSNLMQAWPLIFKENDRSVQSNLEDLQIGAKNYYEANKTFVGFNTETSMSAPQIIKIINNFGGRAAFVYIAKDKYCITKELPDTKGVYWCIDNNGYAGVSNNCTKKTYSCQ